MTKLVTYNLQMTFFWSLFTVSNSPLHSPHSHDKRRVTEGAENENLMHFHSVQQNVFHIDYNIIYMTILRPDFRS